MSTKDAALFYFYTDSIHKVIEIKMLSGWIFLLNFTTFLS